MFDRLLELAFRAADVRPDYTKARCLAVTQSPAACHACRDVCPHDAIKVQARGVTIDESDCTGCGLCVHACPSGALAPKVRVAPGASIACSKVAGSAQKVPCLTRLQATDLVRLARGRSDVTLAHGACSGCDVGSDAVPARMHETAAVATRLLARVGREVAFHVEPRSDLVDDAREIAIDRRALFKRGVRGMAEGTADLLEPLDRGGEPDSPLPAEAERRYLLIQRSNPTPDEPVEWPLPMVGDACFTCPVCAKACPTRALSRTFHDDGTVDLVLNATACIGCRACVTACPVDAVTLEDTPPWDACRSTSTVVHTHDPSRSSAGTVAR